MTILFLKFLQREVELRELQEQNALVLQDIAEFAMRHVEAEAYIKKLLMAKNIELPSFRPPSKSPMSPYGSSSGSIDQPLKSTSRISTFASSRESIGSIVKIEPQFEEGMCVKIKLGHMIYKLTKLLFILILISFIISYLK